MTVDPVKDGMNWYSYVNGDPINLYDPLGLCDADSDSWRNVMKEQQPMMRGDDVEELQEFLGVDADGYYGSQTADAVKQYQQDNGLDVDGVVGPDTRDAIKEDLGIEDEVNDGYLIPAEGTMRAGAGEYGAYRDNSVGMHTGVDIIGEEGDSIVATKSGKIVNLSKVDNGKGYGRFVYIDHGDGTTSRYAHLEEVNVNNGDFVNGGEQIGTMGRSGNVTTEPTHLHFEIREKKNINSADTSNQNTDPVNPHKYIPELDDLPME